MKRDKKYKVEISREEFLKEQSLMDGWIAKGSTKEPKKQDTKVVDKKKTTNKKTIAIMGGRGGKKINMEVKLSKTYLLFSGFITVKKVRVIRLRFFNANRYFYIPISKLGLDSNVKMSDYSTEELLNGLRDKVLKYTNDRDIKAYETRMAFEMAQNDAKRLAFEEKRRNKKPKNTPK